MLFHESWREIFREMKETDKKYGDNIPVCHDAQT